MTLTEKQIKALSKNKSDRLRRDRQGNQTVDMTNDNLNVLIDGMSILIERDPNNWVRVTVDGATSGPGRTVHLFQKRGTP